MSERAEKNGDPTKYDLKLQDLVVTTNETKLPEDKWKLFSARFDYVWRAFDHHAKQKNADV